MKFVPVSTLREAVNYLLIEQGKLDEVKQAESAYNLYKFKFVFVVIVLRLWSIMFCIYMLQEWGKLFNFGT